MSNETISIGKVARIGAWTTAILVVYVAHLSVFARGLGSDAVVFAIAFAPLVVAGVFLLCAVTDALKRWQVSPVKKATIWLALAATLVAVSWLLLAEFKPTLLEFVALAPPAIVCAVAYVRFLSGKKWTLMKTDSTTGDPPASEESNLFPAALRDSASQSMLQGKSTAVAAAIVQFHNRAQSLIDRATTVLFVIILVLVFTAAFIIFAGKIAELGVVRMDPFSDLKTDRAELEDEISSVLEELRTVNESLYQAQERAATLEQRVKEMERLESINQSPEKRFPIGMLQEDQAMYNVALFEGKRYEALGNQLALKLENLLKRQEKLDDELQNARMAMLTTITQSGSDSGQGMLNSITDPKLLLATGITRFGVLIIAIYLVQILINLYRYNTRTAAYYLAHADALVVAKKGEDIETLQVALFPDIDYGKAPSPVSRKFADSIAKAIDQSVGRILRRDSSSSP